MAILSSKWLRFEKGPTILLAILLIVLSLVPPSGLWAMPTTAKDARAVVEGWLKLEAAPMGSRMGGIVREVKSYGSQDDSYLYYIVYLSPSGFVIVPADDLVEPIIGFLPQGIYDPSSNNPLGALVHRDVSGRVLAVRQNKSSSRYLQEAQRKWTLLKTPRPDVTFQESGIPNISDIRVPPLIQSKWDQGTVNGDYCYNYYTPNKYVCGCVATSMSQLMRFWQYPTTGVGTPSFVIYVDGLGRWENLRGGDGAGGPYNWANMILDPISSGINDTQRRAIGALTHDAGVTVNMEYTSNQGSGAYAYKIPWALMGTFKYGNAQYYPTIIRHMVTPNLHAGCPVLFGIRGAINPDTGHSVICDGYGYNTGTEYHHLNMGWSGAEDAWYNLPDIGTVYEFNTISSCTYNIFPPIPNSCGSIMGCGQIISGRVVDTRNNPISKVTVSAIAGEATFTATTNSNGVYGIRCRPSTNYWLRASKSGYTFNCNDDAWVVGTGVTGFDEGSIYTTGNLGDINPIGTAQAPIIALNQSALNPSCQQGQNAPAHSFQVWNSGVSTLNYGITSSASWLSCTPNSGSSNGENDTITVNYSTGTLTIGNHNATITITAPGAANSPQTIAVTLTVSPSLNTALDNDSLSFTTGGGGIWFGQQNTSYYGGSAAKSGDINDNQTSWMQTTVTGPTMLSFYKKVSCEATYDYLACYVDEVEQPGRISGEVDWQQQMVAIPAGSHTVRWSYSKDGSVSRGSDCAWVDKVVAPRPNNALPIIILLLCD
jgi:hypothetical protein